MVIRKCDRCNEVIKNNYWTIDIYQHADNIGRVSTNGSMNNIEQNINKTLNRQKEYCEECINEIRNFIKKK